MKVDPVEIGRRIQQARKRAGLTQAQLAEAAAVTNETISRTERGTYEPALSTVVAVSGALGIDLRQLVEGESGEKSLFSRGSGAETALFVRTVEVLSRLSNAEQAALLRVAELFLARKSADAKPARG